MFLRRTLRLPSLLVAGAFAILPLAAGAQDGATASPVDAAGATSSISEDGGPSDISLELNAFEAADGGACRVSFVAHNDLGEDLAALGYEMVLFGRDGAIARMTTFDFGAMPAGKTVVRRFLLPDLTCDSVGRVLINGSAACEGAAAADACEAKLTTSTRADLIFGL